jgi:PAS domain S-box-containing protein
MCALELSQKAVPERMRFLRILLDTIPNPVFYRDKEGRFRFCNVAFAEQLACKPMEQILGKTLDQMPEAFPKPLVDLMREQDRRLQVGSSEAFLTPIVCQDGEQREFLVSKGLFASEQGEVEGVFGVMFDISEEKQKERALEISNRRLAEAMDLAQLVCWELDPQKRELIFNDAIYAMFGTTAEREGGYRMSIDVYLHEFSNPEDTRNFHEILRPWKLSQQGHQRLSREFRICRRDGQIRCLRETMDTTRDANGEILAMQGVAIDITDVKKYEEDMRKLWCAIKSTPAAVIITDLEGKIEYVNPKFTEITGYGAEEVIGRNRRLLKTGLQSPESFPEMWETSAQINVWRGEICNRKKDGTFFWADVAIAPVRTGDGVISHYVAIETDITSRKQAVDELLKAEEALQHQDILLRAMAGAAPQAYYVVDNRTDEILFFNDHFCEMWGLSSLRERMQHKKISHSELLTHFMALVGHPAAFAAWFVQLQDISNRQIVEDEIELKNGRTVRCFSNQVRDAQDTYIGRLYLFEDVTERKRASQQIAASLKEKEILLREVYHRVKNNMQVISSLLNLQSDSFTDTQTLQLIRETKERIRSMALVHEKLYLAKDLSRIDFAEYAQQLVTILVHSYCTEPNPIDVQFEMTSIQLNLDTAIPCGLILNELVSNALKYAFPPGKQYDHPRILISLQRLANDHYQLSVSDNGLALPANFDERKTSTLGLQVVTLLTEQLEGTLDVRCSPEICFCVTFKEIMDRSNKRRQGVTGLPATGANSPDIAH